MTDERDLKISEAAMVALSIAEVACEGVGNDGIETPTAQLIEYAARSIHAMLRRVLGEGT